MTSPDISVQIEIKTLSEQEKKSKIVDYFLNM
jgi:hypothetical protein